jgi:dipeptide transport system permease protein
MLRFIFTRFSLIIPTFLGIVFLAFILIHLVPGDPVEVRMGERGIAPARHAELLHEMGLDRPLYVQFADYVGNVLHGNLGVSLITHRPVLSEFFDLFPATLELSVCAVIFAIVFGLPAGMLAGVKRNSPFDHMVMGVTVAGYSLPIFVWGLVLILTFSLDLGWTPVSGRISLEYDFDRVTGFMTIDALLSDQEGAFASALSHLILPTIALGTIPLAVIARMTRSSMLEVLGEDYIRTARAKGASEPSVNYHHALKNAVLPVITVIGIEAAFLIGGLIVTETVFNIPGIARFLVEALRWRDYPIVQNLVMFIAIVVIVANLLVDMLYGVLDPRVRYGS